MIDAKYGIVLDSILGKSDSNERELLKEHIKNVKNLVNLKDLILVIDAGYYSLEFRKTRHKLYIQTSTSRIFKRNIKNDHIR